MSGNFIKNWLKYGLLVLIGEGAFFIFLLILVILLDQFIGGNIHEFFATILVILIAMPGMILFGNPGGEIGPAISGLLLPSILFYAVLAFVIGAIITKIKSNRR